MASVNCKDIIGTENCFTSMNKSINKDWFFFFPLLVFSETAPEVTQEQEQEELGGGAKLLEQGIEDKVLKKKKDKVLMHSKLQIFKSHFYHFKGRQKS